MIEKNHIHYGWYTDIRWALYDRDRLIEVDWDLGEWVYLPERENKYLHMELPPKNLKRWRQYIYPDNNQFRIIKTINGKKKYFGRYNTIDEAIKRRNELMECDWNESS